MWIFAVAIVLCAGGTSRAQQKTDRPDEPLIVIEKPEEESPRYEPSTQGPSYLDRVVDENLYVVGPGDQLGISVGGQAPTTYQVRVNPEGAVLIPSIGIVTVAGKTLAGAKAALLDFLRAYFPRAKLAISLLEIRRFRVTVSGAVARPGLQVVTASTRASEAVEMAGPDITAARRSIRLIRQGDTLSVDLTAFERLGEEATNPYVIEGDVIVVPALNKKWGNIRVSGAVNDPGSFEFVAGESVGDLIDLAYGLVPNVDTTKVELWRFVGDDTVATRLDWDPGTTLYDWRQVSLQADDHLIVRGEDDYRQRSAVEIRGEVIRPGVYVFPGRNVSLLALVDSAGGFTDRANVSQMRVARGRLPEWETEYRNRLEKLPQELLTQAESDWLLADAISVPGRISTDFVKLFDERDRTYDVNLSNDDVVTVPAHTSFVSVIGRVVRPGLVPHAQDQPFDYYLERAGGFAWRADRGGSFVVKGGTGATVKRGSVKNIAPGDLIVVPTKRGINFWEGFKDALVVTANLATIYLVVDQAIN
jgi:protein involved in polysaccharide export with SLBB domain